MEPGKRKHRYKYTGGIKALEESKHARNIAFERYGKPKYFDGAPSPKDETLPQFESDKRGPGYANETKGWVRAAGENATNKPGYVHGPRTTPAYPYSGRNARSAGILPSKLRDNPSSWLAKVTPRKK
jgi:hypothetical protein